MPVPNSQAGHEGRRRSPYGRRIALLLTAFAVRALTLTAQGLWRDEVDQWRFAFLSLSELLSNLTRPGWNGPLYSIVLRGWIALTGESVFAMRYLSVLCGLLSLALGYALARRLWGRRVGWLALWLPALSPYLVWYAQEIKMYAWVPMLALIALYALDRACRTPRAVLWLTVFLATTLAIYSHILAALLMPVLGLWFLWHPSRARQAWAGALVVAAGLTLPYLPLLRWQAALAWMPRETGFPRYNLGEMAMALLNGWSVGIRQGAWARQEVLIAAMFLYGGLTLLGLLGSPRRSVDGRTVWRRVLSLVTWLLLPLLGIWLLSLRGPIFTDRYLIWSAPAFYMLVALGVDRLWRWHTGPAWLALGLLTLLSVHGLWVQATDPIKPEFAQAAATVDAGWAAGDLLLFQIPYNRLVYEVYGAARDDDVAEAPYTNWRDAGGDYLVDGAYVGRELRRLVANRDRIWLIYSEARLWDDRELVKGWLDTTYDLAGATHYVGVSVLLYVRPAR